MKLIKLPKKYKTKQIESINHENKHTYDIEVNKSHYYLLEDGTVSHNSTSMLVNVNGGLEPYFQFEYERNDVLGKRIIVPEIVKELQEQNLYDEYKEYLVTAEDVTPEQHIKTQAKFQEFIDGSISKCVDIKNTMVIINNKIYYMDELFENKHINEDEFFDVSQENFVLKNHKKENVEIKSLYNNGIQNVIKLTFDDNSTFSGTLNHKVYIDDKWEKLSDVKIGMQIKP